MFEAILAFFIVLAVLVLAHEFGHFISAKKYGVRVEEFGFGFPPRLFSFSIGESLYSFNLLPLGGFVRILGENGEDSQDPSNFSSRPAYQKAVMLSAGIFFNLVLAAVIFSFVFWLGMPVDADDPMWASKAADARISVIGVVKDSAAEGSGLKPGDFILSLESVNAENFEPRDITDIQDFIKESAGKEIVVEVGRGEAKISLPVLLPESEIEDGVVLGIAMAKIGIVREPWYKAPVSGTRLTASAFWGTAKGLWRILTLLFSSNSVSGMVSGPVGIFSAVSGTLDFGPPFLLSLIALLSVNLALMNLLPLPALDGGRLLFLVFEKIRGRPINQKTGGLAHAAGFAILILLMAVITYYDVKNGF
ncbi:MAG: site-2 protease family protein [Candidatus Niyogibacteria bacterium]|nr:site-2 protease family protein [Candidatus Niyogibacteria bacterium]